MENASKALIIAGAILISILLISVGIIVMNTINEPVDEAGRQADQQAVEMFNSKFTAYGGKGQRAASVKALITAVNSAKKTRPITIVSGGTESTTAFTAGMVETGKTYTVDFDYDGDGYIKKVAVKVETATPATPAP